MPRPRSYYMPLGSPARPARDRSHGDPDVLGHPTVQAVAAQAGVTPAQAVLAWALQRGVAIVPKSVTPSRLDENRAACAVTLTPAQVAAIDGLNAHARLIKGHVFLWASAAGWWDLWDEAEGATAEA